MAIGLCLSNTGGDPTNSNSMIFSIASNVSHITMSGVESKVDALSTLITPLLDCTVVTRWMFEAASGAVSVIASSDVRAELCNKVTIPTTRWACDSSKRVNCWR